MLPQNNGLIGLTKVLALEGAEFGITANAICPGFVKTPLVEKQIADLAKGNHVSEDEVINANFISQHLIKQFVTNESIGALAVFLASDHASIITGTCMPVDGGWSKKLLNFYVSVR